MEESRFPRGIELVTGAYIENEKGEILFAQSPKWNNKWTVPGGHIDPGEAILDACVREGEEETGLKLKGVEVFRWGELIDSKDFHRSAHFVYFDAHCVIQSGEVRLDELELSAYKWMLPEEAMGLDFADSYKDSFESFLKYKRELP